ncbi:TetR/AcrR family transcriptional regulator [Macrococcoides canis]|uniref:TetR family transcriptional regulator n=1 Tax=Abyssicoccus albus TaxID=1817405 RepID=A0A3N5C5X5_9BACL|nr:MULTISPECIES: TetR/AcrR family transcriptional regulator [Bacillales]RPF57708.1 TetR family transcriptional regulator [Abyssicoccus albus]TDM19635.1 TetR/AcrR family transcriptional regulator [Macrococcus canis]TDM22540.1 TetR/AcrR family transcriptional regulator [Macrococcus canis]TDM35519.1 TetR/AcrR family transcriptional regulator [Macrococcus canis]
MSTKEKILNVSKLQFAAYGYEATTMSMIAEEVGIKKPSLYSHYSSKAAIFKDVLDAEFDEYLSFVKEILNNKNQSAVEKLSALYVAHLPGAGEDDADNDFYYRFVKHQPAGLEEYTLGKYRESEKKQFEIFNDVVNDGKAEGEIDSSLSSLQIYETYFLIIDGIDSMRGLYDLEYIRKSSENVWQVFYRGIKP